MTGLGNFGANMGLNAGVNANAHLNAHAGFGHGMGYGGGMGGYGYSSAGAILVLFILLVIISRTIYA
jgi:uncharacterized membrane protein